VSFDHLNCRIIGLKKVAFLVDQEAEKTSKWKSTTWIIAFLT